jgi:hypothetical protein
MIRQCPTWDQSRLRGFDGFASIVKRGLGERRSLGERLRQFKSLLFQFVATHQVTFSSA